MRTAIAAACIVLALAAGCSLLNPDGGKFKPEGTKFTLDPGIQTTAITGSDTGYSRFGLFPVEIRGRSTTGQAVFDTLVGGLFFVSLNSETQHIVVIKPQVVSFGAAETSLVIGGFCCNPELDAPGAEDGFEIGPVTDNADLRKIVDICADRNVTYSTVTVQMAVWQVTDGDGLTAAMEDSLHDLPPDSSLLYGRPCLPDIKVLKPLRPGR
jgi:hypothetical protein